MLCSIVISGFVISFVVAVVYKLVFVVATNNMLGDKHRHTVKNLSQNIFCIELQ